MSNTEQPIFPQDFIASDNTVLLSNDSTNPIPLEEVKSFLNIYDDSQDVYLESLQQLAIKIIEDYSGIDITRKTYKSFLDYLPKGDIYNTLTYNDYGYHNGSKVPLYGLLIPKAPYVDTLIVKYLDVEGVEQTVDLNDWYTKQYNVYSKNYSYTVPKEGYPDFTRQPSSITLEYQAGITSDGTVLPIDLKQAILYQMGHSRDIKGDECGDCVSGLLSGMIPPLLRTFKMNNIHITSAVS